jgi:hypothetical protein
VGHWEKEASCRLAAHWKRVTLKSSFAAGPEVILQSWNRLWGHVAGDLLVTRKGCGEDVGRTVKAWAVSGRLCLRGVSLKMSTIQLKTVF